MTVDIEKALDSINHSFLMCMLKNFGFGNEFRKWIQILMKNQESCSGADNDLKTLIIVQIFNKEDFFLILPLVYSLCIVVYETSTFFHITGSDDVIFMIIDEI